MSGARGEEYIQLSDGSELRILMTNRALIQVEDRMNGSIIEISQGFSEGSSGITEVVQLLRSGMDAARLDEHRGGRGISRQDALDVLDDVGFAGVAEAVMLAVGAVLSYKAGGEDADPNE